MKFNDGSRTAWQCLATQNPDGTFRKQGPVLALPAGYSGHVRDPKVWRDGDRWLMVLGARNLADRGKVLLFSSTDLMQWNSHGEIAGSGLNGERRRLYVGMPGSVPARRSVYFTELPAGLPREAQRFLNTYPAVWMQGHFDQTAATAPWRDRRAG